VSAPLLLDAVSGLDVAALAREFWRADGRPRKRKGPPPGPITHGTRNGAEAHRRRKEPMCDWCARAERDYFNRRNAAGKCAAGLGWPLLGGDGR